MRKLLALVIATAMMVSIPTAFSATPKVGGSCTKINKFQKLGSMLLICVVANKKKTWRNATLVEKSTYQKKLLSAAAAEAKRLADITAAAEAKRLADITAAAEAKRLADIAAAAEAKRLADIAAAAEAKRLADIAAAKAAADTKPVPIKIFFTIRASRAVNCAYQKIGSRLESARLIVPSGGGIGAATYVYYPGRLELGEYGASVTVGRREYWSKDGLFTLFKYRYSENWYADVEATCSYLQY